MLGGREIDALAAAFFFWSNAVGGYCAERFELFAQAAVVVNHSEANGSKLRCHERDLLLLFDRCCVDRYA